MLSLWMMLVSRFRLLFIFLNSSVLLIGHILALLNFYTTQICVTMIAMTLLEVTIFRCLYIKYWTRMVSIDEDFLTIICIEFNSTIGFWMVVANFSTQQYSVNYFYNAFRNLYDLSSPLKEIYPNVTFW